MTIPASARLLFAALAGLALTTLPLRAADAPDHAKGSEPIHISHGDEVNLSDYLVPGKTTVFDFYSEYCPPCREISPYLTKLHAARPDLAVVKIDINRPGHRGIDWGSPVARQYDLHSIPHFTIVNPAGKVVADGDEAYDKVVDWIKAQNGS